MTGLGLASRMPKPTVRADLPHSGRLKKRQNSFPWSRCCLRRYWTMQDGRPDSQRETSWFGERAKVSKAAPEACWSSVRRKRCFCAGSDVGQGLLRPLNGRMRRLRVCTSSGSFVVSTISGRRLAVRWSSVYWLSTDGEAPVMSRS